MLGVGTMRESKVLDFHQHNGEIMKKAWDRISEAHKRIMPWIPIRIVLRNFTLVFLSGVNTLLIL